jgi:hypothetical protein
MSQFRLHHRHEPGECAASYTAWKGFQSPLRGESATSSCREGDHDIWWDVDVPDAAAALQLLPRYVAVRTQATRVTSVAIP